MLEKIKIGNFIDKMSFSEYFRTNGFVKEILKEPLRYIENIKDTLKKDILIHNGKILKIFDAIYDELYIAGYYKGMLHRVDIVKSILKGAEGFIKKLE